MDMVTPVQILNGDDCFSHSTDTLKDVMNPTTLPTFISK